jgi:hypothetical protein
LGNIGIFWMAKIRIPPTPTHRRCIGLQNLTQKRFSQKN